MDSIKVTPENLRTQAGKVDQEATDYFNEYNSLLRDVELLTSTDYTGEDANEFLQKVRGFEPDFSKMKNLMNEYASFLRQSADNYQNTQENVKNMIKSQR